MKRENDPKTPPRASGVPQRGPTKLQHQAVDSHDALGGAATTVLRKRLKTFWKHALWLRPVTGDMTTWLDSLRDAALLETLPAQSDDVTMILLGRVNDYLATLAEETRQLGSQFKKVVGEVPACDTGDVSIRRRGSMTSVTSDSSSPGKGSNATEWSVIGVAADRQVVVARVTITHARPVSETVASLLNRRIARIANLKRKVQPGPLAIEHEFELRVASGTAAPAQSEWTRRRRLRKLVN
jgi:hypothetical protein